MRKTPFTTALLAAAALGAAAPAASADDLLVAASPDDSTTLLAFDADQARKAVTLRITNPPAGRIVGLDRRPATDTLYLTAESLGPDTIYTVALDLQARTATLATASVFSADLVGTSFGSDFNPVPDRLRTTSDAEQNLRTNVETGATTVDKPLVRTDGRAPDVVASAYTNSDTDPTTGTTLYDIDAAQDELVIQNPPNDGVLVPVGPLGVTIDPIAGFDITPPAAGSVAYAALLQSKQAGQGSRLFTIDLATGRATVGQKIGKDEARIGSLAYVGEAPDGL